MCERGGDHFRAVRLLPLARGEQKSESWCRRLSAWQTLQFGRFLSPLAHISAALAHAHTQQQLVLKLIKYYFIAAVSLKHV